VEKEKNCEAKPEAALVCWMQWVRVEHTEDIDM